MNNWQGMNVWITGASSGIGRELATRLAQQGARVYASARSEQALLALREHGVEALPCDVTDRGSLRAAAQELSHRAGHLDVLVANAGTCEYVDAAAFDSGLVERVFAVNFFGAVYTLEAALPLLRAGSTRYIVGVGSTAAFNGLPRAEAYGASKAALHHFLESLRVDLTGEGFAVSVVAPGFVETPLTDRNDFAMPMRIGVGSAVDYMLDGMAARRHLIHFPPVFSWPVRALQLLPSSLRNRLLQRLVRTRENPA
jgi:NAD(P)-dependent dehydrogenase (short-subunit alcohol dehydrogenase family)